MDWMSLSGRAVLFHLPFWLQRTQATKTFMPSFALSLWTYLLMGFFFLCRWLREKLAKKSGKKNYFKSVAKWEKIAFRPDLFFFWFGWLGEGSFLLNRKTSVCWTIYSSLIVIFLFSILFHYIWWMENPTLARKGRKLTTGIFILIKNKKK